MAQAKVIMKPMLLVMVSMLWATAPALASCPIERATYADTQGPTRLEFMPASGAATVSNSFRMLLDNNVVLDGIVQWTDGVARPNGKLMYKCPEGDATGQELDICTVWQGVIYTADDTGVIGLLPAEGADAPKTLIFPDLGYALRYSSAYGPNGFSAVPWDAFSQRGCQ
jgi:hypothetical protein